MCASPPSVTAPAVFFLLLFLFFFLFLFLFCCCCYLLMFHSWWRSAPVASCLWSSGIRNEPVQGGGEQAVSDYDPVRGGGVSAGLVVTYVSADPGSGHLDALRAPQALLSDGFVLREGRLRLLVWSVVVVVKVVWNTSTAHHVINHSMTVKSFDSEKKKYVWIKLYLKR